jgi:uncharacterized protein (AIM24 family)
MTTSVDYYCRYCRLPSDASGISCPNCGAPTDIREVKSKSGWEQQPPIADMTRIQFGQSYVQIEGTQVPVADFDLRGPESLYFSHHVMLWVDNSARIGNMPMKGGWSRIMGGLPLVMLTANGPGHVALSDNHAGEIVALPMPAGRPVWVREHRFLAATGDVVYDWRNTGVYYTVGTGDDKETVYPLGMIADVFHAPTAPGLLLLHSPGNTFIRDLAPGESLLIQPTALLYCDLSVNMHLHFEYPRFQKPTWHSRYSHRYVWLRLTGPGRVAVQSVFERPEGSDQVSGGSYYTEHFW